MMDDAILLARQFCDCLRDRITGVIGRAAAGEGIRRIAHT